MNRPGRRSAPACGFLTLLAAALVLAAAAERAFADRIQVAVASNFAGPLARIAERFERRAGHQVILVPGSTGKHYAQIRNGAPFAAFFAADVRRPAQLEEDGAIVTGSRFTYAVGRLALWSPAPGLVDPEGRVLEHGEFRHLAMANPRLAPYGRAARQALHSLGLWEALQDRLVFGENIGHTFHFVNSGNADLGLVAYSQVMQPGDPVDGDHWLVPQSLHAPIEQQAVSLVDTEPVRAFLAFVKSGEALAIIRGFGYGTP